MCTQGKWGKRGPGRLGKPQAGRPLGSSLPLRSVWPQHPECHSGISHKSFLSSSLEQFIRLREPSQLLPNNSTGQVFKEILPRNYAHKFISLTGVLARHVKLV